MGRIDLHNHLLFDLDDGARNADETLQIARSMVQAGYSDVVVTPHSRPDMDPTSDVVQARLNEVQALLDASGIALKLHQGCENHLTPEFLSRAAAGEPRTLAGSRYVLVELPFASPVPGLRELLFQLQLKGLRPLIAHPERCAQFVGREKTAEALFDAGVGFQLEVGSLTGMYGSDARRCAQRLLDAGLVVVVGTDIHHPRSGDDILRQGLPALEKHVGSSRLQALSEDNPRRLLLGKNMLAA